MSHSLLILQSHIWSMKEQKLGFFSLCASKSDHVYRVAKSAFWHIFGTFPAYNQDKEGNKLVGKDGEGLDHAWVAAIWSDRKNGEPQLLEVTWSSVKRVFHIPELASDRQKGLILSSRIAILSNTLVNAQLNSLFFSQRTAQSSRQS